ncbi:MAG TPA: EamA family transporter [Janthinobacterium sp.]|nr:EamA family transporter [Janthinobacterium sp.]
MQSLWMLFASFMFAIMGVCVKLASSQYSTSEIVMYRGLVGVVVMGSTILYRRGSFATRMPGAHLWRGVVGVVALWLWFYAIAILPLATAMTLNYMAPIWIAVILFCAGWWQAKNQLEWPLVGAIGFSFVGVTLLLQPAFHSQQMGAAITALISGMLSALAYLQVRKLGLLGEPEYRVVFYFSVVNFLAGLLGNIASAGLGPVVWHAHTGVHGIALLLGIGLCATMAQMAMTRAYRLGKTLVVANLQYTGIVFSSIWGVLIFGDLFDWHGWVGIGVILVSGSAASYYNTRNTSRGAAIARTDPIASEV